MKIAQTISMDSPRYSITSAGLEWTLSHHFLRHWVVDGHNAPNKDSALMTTRIQAITVATLQRTAVGAIVIQTNLSRRRADETDRVLTGGN
jgi:hypothetical protein